MRPIDLYEARVQPARDRFPHHRGVAALLFDDIDRETFHRLMLHFCALGAQMTGPVEGWILRAGERCETLGLADLGRALRGHSRAEAGHDQMMVRDTEALVDRWNQQYRPRFEARQLLSQAVTPGVRAYCDVHERTIEGPAPFAQIAVEYEIEQLPLRYGRELIGRCTELLGADVVPCLSFLTEHVELDIGHTKFNHLQLTRFLEAHPEHVEQLADAGARALEAYAAFLDDCADLALAPAAAAGVS